MTAMIEVFGAYYDVCSVFLAITQVLEKRKSQLSLKYPVPFPCRLYWEISVKIAFLNSDEI